MVFLVVLTADGGIPLFTRSAGDTKSKLPFATLGSMNSVHMFSRLREAELKRAVSPEEMILWREYHDRLVLILITRNEACSDCHLSILLDNIFSAIIMIVGIDFILKPVEVPRLQKTLVACYPLIDCLLNKLEQENYTMGDLTRKTDCLLSTDIQILQEHLNKFLDVADSLYGCLLIKGNIVVASKEWWSLTNQEKNLICTYVNVLPKVLSREVVIYLPTSSPQNSNRLVTLHLLRDVEVCVLCSNEPTLAVLEEEAPKVWKDCFDMLKIVSNLHPRNFPKSIVLDKSIQSVMLINTDTNQCMSSLNPSIDEANSKAKNIESAVLNERHEALRTLYKVTVGTYFKNLDATMDDNLKASNSNSTFDYGDCDFINCTPREYYFYTDKKKCYVINRKPYQIFNVFNSEIPNYAIRYVSHQTLDMLTEEHMFPDTFS